MIVFKSNFTMPEKINQIRLYVWGENSHGSGVKINDSPIICELPSREEALRIIRAWLQDDLLKEHSKSILADRLGFKEAGK